MLETSPFIQKLQMRHELVNRRLCIGLDPDIALLPEGFEKNIEGVYQFLDRLIQVTEDLALCYKPNLAFFEAFGLDGFLVLDRICKLIPSDVPIILDAKRGDIGNTSAKQAKFLFDYFPVDATTLHPYMGYDSLTPFFDYKDKFHFVLGLTSNPGSQDLERQLMADGRYLYERVLGQIQEHKNEYGNVGAVVGATHDDFAHIRAEFPDLDLLVPGVGAQGGSYHDVLNASGASDGEIIINVGRAVMYAAETREDMESVIRETITEYYT